MDGRALIKDSPADSKPEARTKRLDAVLPRIEESSCVPRHLEIFPTVSGKLLLRNRPGIQTSYVISRALACSDAFGQQGRETRFGEGQHDSATSC